MDHIAVAPSSRAKIGAPAASSISTLSDTAARKATTKAVTAATSLSADQHHIVRTAAELAALLEGHAASGSAYAQLLINGEPLLRQEVRRARALVAAANRLNSTRNLEFARQTLRAIHEMPRVDLTHFETPATVAALLTGEAIHRYRAIPLMLWREHVVLGISELPERSAIDVLRFLLQRHIVYVRLSRAQMDERVDRFYRTEEESEALRELEALEREQTSQDDDANEYATRDAESLAKRAPIVNLVQSILADAVRMRASDIHIRPGKQAFELLYRVDGTLIRMRDIRATLLPAVVSRIKILSGLDITERRIPQDGRIKMEVAGNAIDLRISVIPVQYGESVVIRILDKSASLRSVDEIGFKASDKAQFLDLLRRSYGVILVTGPTGSGKTTTLYAALQAVQKENVNIVTVEDPIEYELIGARQIQLLPQIDFGFPQALRHILRHDPDVIMIGEMRDLETCKIAIESALTGHLVFSTLHTNDAASALVRLLEIGIAPYMIRSAVIGVFAQRLVRKNCPHCRVEEEIDPLLRANLSVSPNERFFRGAGCEHCHFTGFFGRMAIYELMVMNDAIRARIGEGVASDEFRRLAVEGGMITLPVNGVEQARTGEVSLAEVYRACM